MFKRFYPYEYVESVYALDYSKIYNLGYRAVIFDIDNTLVHHGEDATPEIEELFRKIHRCGLKTLLLSNNCDDRILRFIKNIETKYIPDADKPDTKGYYKALEVLGIKKEEALYVGDQVFTDVLGANKCGMDNVLVKYMRYDTEKKIGIKRNLEKIVLWFYKFSRFRNRIGDILKGENNG